MELLSGKLGQHIHYNATALQTHQGADFFAQTFAVIFPKIYVDSIRNYHWKHHDIDLIEDGLGKSIEFILNVSLICNS